MRRGSWVWTTKVGVTVVTAVLVTGCFAGPVRVGAQEDPGLAGWYEREDGSTVLVSPGPAGGWRHLDFQDAVFGALEIGAGEGAARVVDDPERRLVFADGSSWRRASAAPYRLEEASWTSADGTRLGGLLLLPPTAERAAVLLHGSGDSDRDNVWAYTFADALARSGIAVAFADKRGSGASSGDWRAAGLDELALDGVAVARDLVRRAGLPTDAVGWVGLSQGGWIAPLAARFAGFGGFVVSVSSAAVPVMEQIEHEIRNDLRSLTLAPAELERALEFQDLLVAHSRGRASWSEYIEGRTRISDGPLAPFAEAMPATPDDWRWAWWARVGTYDPIDSWLRAALPTLVLYGAEDESDNVPVQASLEELDRLRRIPGAPSIETELFQDLGHTLIDPESEWVSERALGRLVSWILSGPGPGD